MEEVTEFVPEEEEDVTDEEFEDFFDEDEEYIGEDFFDDDPGSVSTELLEQFNDPELYEDVEFGGSADIVLTNTDTLHMGDEITLVASVANADVSYRIVWEANDGDKRGWFSIASGDQYSYILDESNLDREYRVVLFTVD